MNVLRKLSCIGIWMCSVTYASNASAQSRTVNISTELEKLTDISALPKYLEGTVVRQTSSYDTTGNNDDGFSGKYSFIRRNPDSSLVIFEAPGNGVINRIWTPTPNDEILDFYFGGSKKPSYSVKFSDLFSGKVFPFVTPLTGNQIGGYFCYFPIPFQNGCKVVSRGRKLQFYQIQYRSYPRNYKIQNFNAALSDKEQSLLKDLAASWSNIKDRVTNNTRNIQTIFLDTLIKPGQTVLLAEINNGGRIVGMEFQSAEVFSGISKQLDIKMTWDDENTPAVYAPAADFFGYAFGKPSMQSLLLGTADDVNYCYFPMPFDRKARIELIYRLGNNPSADKPNRINGRIYFLPGKRDPQAEGKFYTWWNRNINPQMGKPHVFLEGNGKGHYVGTILQARGLAPGMTLFFEGDDSTIADGKMTMHGTGSEDYFNGGWYALLDRWDRKMSLPLHGSLDYSLPFSRTGGYRLFISDKMPFEQNFLHTIEHGPERNNKAVDYTSVALYYANAPISAAQTPSNSTAGVLLPDTLMIYPQLMNFSFAGAVTIDGRNFTSKNGGKIRIDLAEIPSGKYKLYADTETGPDGAEITLWQRQSPVSGPISFYTPQKELKKAKYLCDLNINGFKNTLTLHFKKDDMKNKVNIQRLILIKD